MERLTPQDIREREFKQSALGFNREQVKQFLEEIAEEMETMAREFLELHQENKEARLALQTYSNVEESLKATLIQAKETAAAALKNAHDQADNILRKANTEKDALLFSAKEDLAQIQSEIRHLKAERSAMLIKLKSILSSNLDVLNEVYAETELKPEPAGDTFGLEEERIVDFSKTDLVMDDLPEDIEEPDIIFPEAEDFKEE
ncbi:MAG: DivIVA domain-containing protein [Candidatus Marinimicrobia bacterium]|nr:DivIVA domain-containing protein [Candidatus Neomarinimicrobiota bacterium]